MGKRDRISLMPQIPVFGSFLILLIYLSRTNFLLFHAVAELFSISIAFVMFIIAWHTRKFMNNQYLLLLGIAYLFVGLLDLLHTLSYKGMAIFTDYAFYANQLWVLARVLEAASLLLGFHYLRSGKRMHPTAVFAGCTVYALTGVLMIFVWKIFPACFIPGIGQTPFKLGAEIAIILILIGALLILHRKRSAFDRKIYRLMQISIYLTVLSELAFTFYIDNYGITNVTGHFLKILSFYMIYRSIIVTGLNNPYQLIFSELTEANRIKDQFFSIVSHDLRSPMSGLVETVKLLSTEQKLPPREQQELLGISLETSQLLLHYLDNLHQWVKLQQVPHLHERTPVDLQEILLQAAKLHRTMAEAKEISIKLELPQHKTVLQSDKAVIETLLRNLLHNAVKFSYRNSTVTCIIVPPSGQKPLELSVCDNGVGIPQEQLEILRTGDKQQSNPGTEQEPGTGLGLLLVKSLVEKNGWDLRISSSPGQGSCFTVRFTQ